MKPRLMHPLDLLWTAVFLVVGTPVFVLMTFGLWLGVSLYGIGSNAAIMARGVIAFVRGALTIAEDH